MDFTGKGTSRDFDREDTLNNIFDAIPDIEDNEKACRSTYRQAQYYVRS